MISRIEVIRGSGRGYPLSSGDSLAFVLAHTVPQKVGPGDFEAVESHMIRWHWKMRNRSLEKNYFAYANSS